MINSFYLERALGKEDYKVNPEDLQELMEKLEKGKIVVIITQLPEDLSFYE